MLRYKLRTLLILLAVLPPVLALAWSLWPRAAEDLDKFRRHETGIIEVYNPLATPSSDPDE